MTQKKKNVSSQQTLLVIAGIVVVVIVALIALIFLQRGGTGSFDYSNYTGPVPENTDDPNLVLDGIPRTRTDDGAFIIGNPDARVTIVAFEDFLCPHCQTYQSIVKEFFRDYVATGQARFEFRMLPISQQSATVFAVTECAGELRPGYFWPAHDYIFQQAAAGTLNPSNILRQSANDLDLNYSELLDCVGTADQVVTDTQIATNAEINATPTIRWRLDGGPLRSSPLPQQPTAVELGALVVSQQAR
jgi:hypothetical protein